MSFRKKLFIPILLLAIILATSCSTPLQEVTYMNDIKTGLTYTNGPQPEIYHIRPNDHLYIQVISANPLDAAFLNLVGSMGNSGSSLSSGGNLELISYLVDGEGKIDYPHLGEIEVGNLTTTEVKEILQKRVDEYLENASVIVKLVNRSYAVLGEVGSPGQKTMIKNQLTVFEALADAGNISDYGNHKNVKLIRELPEGKHIIELDLTDSQLIFSPYYYILPHDVLYVEHSNRVYGRKGLAYTAPLSITASVISIGLLILNLFK